MQTVTDLIFLGSKITVVSDCSHEIKRFLFLERKAMTNLSSMLKSRDITLPTKINTVKPMCCKKGDPFQGLKLGSCLTLGNELSEETHVLTKQEILLGRAPGWRAGGWGNPGELLLRFLCLESTLLHEKPKEGPLPHMEGETWGVKTAPYFFYPVLRIF